MRRSCRGASWYWGLPYLFPSRRRTLTRTPDRCWWCRKVARLLTGRTIRYSVIHLTYLAYLAYLAL